MVYRRIVFFPKADGCLAPIAERRWLIWSLDRAAWCACIQDAWHPTFPRRNKMGWEALYWQGQVLSTSRYYRFYMFLPSFCDRNHHCAFSHFDGIPATTSSWKVMRTGQNMAIQTETHSWHAIWLAPAWKRNTSFKRCKGGKGVAIRPWTHHPSRGRNRTLTSWLPS